MFLPGGTDLCAKAVAKSFNKQFGFSNLDNKYYTRPTGPAKSSYTYYQNVINDDGSGRDHFTEKELGLLGRKFSEVFDKFGVYTSDLILSRENFTDLMSPEDYNALKGNMYDAEKDASFLAKEDELHNTIMKNYADTFDKLKRAGTNVSVICCYTDCPTAPGGENRSDISLTHVSVQVQKLQKWVKPWATATLRQVPAAVTTTSHPTGSLMPPFHSFPTTPGFSRISITDSMPRTKAPSSS